MTRSLLRASVGRLITCACLAASLPACGESSIREEPKAPPVLTKPKPKELSTVELARIAMPSFVAIKTPDGTGSGFFVAPDLVVTCFHVVRGNSDLGLKAVGWSGAASSVVGWSESDDLAVLRVTPPASGRGLHVFKGPYVVGSKVVAVSSPLGLEDTVSEGIISALRSEPEDRLQFTAPISPGSSGGPILNDHGEVLGIVASFRATVDRGLTIGQNLNFAIPASLIIGAMRKAHDTTVTAFAAATIPADERKWRELEASVDSVGSHLRESLGNRVGIHFASVIRKSIVERDRDTLKGLLDRTDQLETLRKNLLDRVGVLELLGGDGKRLGSSLVSAWEDWAIDPTEETNGRLTAEIKRTVAFSDEMERRAQRASLPDKFAGFPFMGGAADISEYCFGTRLDPVPGLSSLQCSSVPIRPPFATGGARLTFLNGQLVAIEMEVLSYRDAVTTLVAKYGEPTAAAYAHGEWTFAEKQSFGPNTSYNWTLNGGRIRVGRIEGHAFVMFIRDERDQAVNSSF